MGHLVFLMALFYLIQAFAQNPGIFSLPLTLYLKEEFHFSAAELQAFMGLLVIPWMVKPVYGIISDSRPLWGYRRKSYFLLCYAVAVVVFGWFGFYRPNHLFILSAGLILTSTCIAFSDVLTDATMVEKGKQSKQTGVLQAAQWAAINLGGALLMYLGGVIAERATLSFAFQLTSLVPLAGFVATLVFMQKEERVLKGTVSMGRSVRALWSGVWSSRFLAVVAFIAFLNFSPVPPLLYYQRDVLKFSKKFVGILAAVSNLSAGLGAIVFGLWIRKMSRRLLLNVIIGLSVLASLGLIWMHDEKSAILTTIFTGIVGMIAILGILELAARICPEGAEGTSYALLMSVFNLSGQYGGGLMGGWLWDRGMAFPTLVLIGAGFTLLCWFLIPLLKLQKE